MNPQRQRLISPPCVLCGCRDTLRQIEIDGSAVWRCSHCATDFVFPASSEELFAPRGQQAIEPEWNAEFLSRFERKGETLSLLDIGCGDGSRLAKAFGRRCWRCFGVESSDVARASAQERLGTVASLTDSIEHLIPHVFDVILLLDVLEYCPDPVKLFYALFARGAIEPQTTVVISARNTRPAKASVSLLDRGSARFVSFSSESLRLMLRKLRFKQVEISGLPGMTGEAPRSFPNESAELNNSASHDGVELEAIASGSDFHAFMKERYVPGTWSEIALYEHVPRYLLAARLAPHKAILDLGCGTGYGAAILARAGAASVLGLDIDPSTVEWAQGANREKNLSFSVSSDLGAGLAAESFDLITCFEMIEHVTEPVQRATIASTARLLKKDGILLISTPNPIVTKLYGENPFHLRELTEEDFLALLREQFTHISLNHQFIHAGALIAPKSQIGSSYAQVESLRGTDEISPAAAFIAVCSNEPLPAVSVVNFVDNTDLIRSKIQSGHRVSRLQLEHLKIVEADANLHSQVADLNSRVIDLHSQVIDSHSQVTDLLSQKQQLGDLLTAMEAQVRSLESSRLIQLERAIREGPWTLRKTRKIASILISIALQIRPRTLFSSWVSKKSDAGKASPRS